jgi:hypothetical protein
VYLLGSERLRQLLREEKERQTGRDREPEAYRQRGRD